MKLHDYGKWTEYLVKDSYPFGYSYYHNHIISGHLDYPAIARARHIEIDSFRISLWRHHREQILFCKNCTHSIYDHQQTDGGCEFCPCRGLHENP